MIVIMLSAHWASALDLIIDAPRAPLDVAVSHPVLDHRDSRGPGSTVGSPVARDAVTVLSDGTRLGLTGTR
jgi:hypothetical protein